MPAFYDDNFGTWDMDDDSFEREEFYHQVQEESVEKVCVMCDRTIRLRPQYDKCNSCCEKLERGHQWQAFGQGKPCLFVMRWGT